VRVAKLIHFFATFHTLGGVESILAHHHRLDRNRGLDSLVVSAFIKGGRGKSDPACLGLTGFSTIRDLRRKFSALIKQHQPETVIYHNLWGCHSLCDLDGARRRIGFIHTDSAPMRQILARDAGALDGIIAVSKPIADFAASVWPQPERIRQISYPVAGPSDFSPRPAWHEPFRLGFCGRLLIEQKRVDRLPAVWQKLRAAFPGAQLEILGEGVERKNLQALWRAEKNIIFHGRQTGGDYWRILSGWDAVVFTSDYEGTPISLLEAMSVGVPPVYPVTGSGGEDYVRKLSPMLFYRHDDANSLPAVFQWLKSRSAGEIFSLRRQARELVAAHTLENYFRELTSHLADIGAMPAVARPRAARISGLKARMPFGFWRAKFASVMP
jgi:glycosyltransferase involved in cell wall biosynthesis